jgi:uncharacterized protein YxjI
MPTHRNHARGWVERPPSTERISLTKECGWKDGDRGLTERERTHGKKSAIVCLDTNRPSHGSCPICDGNLYRSMYLKDGPESQVPSELGRTVNITVQQREFSIRSEYEISAPGCIYFAQKKFFSWRDKIKLTGPRGQVLARIIGRLSLFRSRYDFELADGRTYHFWRKKFWKGVFLCESSDDSFTLYEHKGLNYSIFQNNSQVAAFSKNRVKIGDGDRYEILMNDDANLVVVICLALIVDASENEGDTASVTYDFGNIGPEDRPFDRSWEPS